MPVLFLFLSCQNQNQDSKYEALSDSTSVTGLSGDSVKLVKTAAIRSKVKDVETSTKAVSELARNYGGMVFHQTLISREADRRELKLSNDSLLVISTYTPTADIIVRVPSVDLQNFIFNVALLGYITESNTIDIQDKSLVFLKNTLQQKNRTGIIRNLPLSTKNVPGRLTALHLKDEVTDQQIQNTAINADVQYSSVNISFFQNQIVKKEFIPNYHISDYNLPFWNRLSVSLSNGLEFFLSFILVIANLWAFIFSGLTLFFVYKWSNKRRALS